MGFNQKFQDVLNQIDRGQATQEHAQNRQLKFEADLLAKLDQQEKRFTDTLERHVKTLDTTITAQCQLYKEDIDRLTKEIKELKALLANVQTASIAPSVPSVQITPPSEGLYSGQSQVTGGIQPLFPPRNGPKDFTFNSAAFGNTIPFARSNGQLLCLREDTSDIEL